MKKRRQQKLDSIKDNFPFLNDENHIYNSLVDGNYGVLNVGWEKFTFELHSNLINDSVKVDGLTEFDRKVIRLEMNLSDSDARETLFHEILHCALEGIGLDERNFDGQSISTTNEFLVTSITRNLKIINDLNPGLFCLIFKEKL